MKTFRQFASAYRLNEADDGEHDHEFRVSDVKGGIKSHIRAAKKHGVKLSVIDQSYRHQDGTDYDLSAVGKHEHVTNWAKQDSGTLRNHDWDHPRGKEVVRSLHPDSPEYHKHVSDYVKKSRI